MTQAAQIIGILTCGTVCLAPFAFAGVIFWVLVRQGAK